jgi:hypothetical protein
MRRSVHSICDGAWLCLAMHSLAHEKCHLRPLSNHELVGTQAAHQLAAVADTCSATTDQSETSVASYTVSGHHFIDSLLS